MELGIFDAGLPSLLGLNVLSILPFFSGEGVRDFLSSDTSTDKLEAFIVCVRLLIRFEMLPELFRGVIEGRVGSGGGLERSVYPIGGIVPPPSQSADAPISLCECGGGVGTGPSEADGRLSFDSSRLFFNTSSRSTRSLHWSSSCRRDSMRAFSVSDAGR
jgi:hypothetical protein